MKAITSIEGIHEYRLMCNQLKVLRCPMPFKGVVGVMITYLVGSRHEQQGQTGATHFLEHMMFKGSQKYQKDLGNDIDHLEAIGAQINASTWMDRTNYYALLPSEYLGLVIDMEADRMRHALLRPEDVASEKMVILNEHDQGENAQHAVLLKALWAKAFQQHGYHHPTIGWRQDIENTTENDLRQYYDQYYHPSMATLTLVGDISPEWATFIHRSFDGIADQDVMVPTRVEPEQTQERRFTIQHASPEDLCALAFKIPKALDQDFLACELLASLLGDGPISLLAKACVDQGLVRWIYADACASYEPGLLSIVAAVCPGVDVRTVEDVIWGVIDSVINEGVNQDRLQQVVMQMEADRVFQNDGIMDQLQWLNEAIAMGCWHQPFTRLQHIKQLNVSDIQSACQQYCQRTRATVGYLIRES